MPASSDVDPDAEKETLSELNHPAKPATSEIGGSDENPPVHNSSDASESKIGYDVVTSAASPTPLRKPARWDLFLLYNVAIPIALVLCGVLIIRMLGKAEAQPAPPTDRTRVGVLQSLPPARIESIQSLAETGRQLELVIDGTVVPFREARVASEVAGRVIYKDDNCEAGAIVKKGDVLMRIDPTDYQLEFERLTSMKEQEYRAIGEVDQEMLNSRRSIDVARQEVRLRQKEVERQLGLDKFGSVKDLDSAKSALLQASQQLVSLENQLDLQKTRRARLEASEQLAATQLRVAEVNLKRCEILAPIDGVIVSEEADVDTFVSRGAALVTIEDVNQVEVAASMRMDQLHWVIQQETPSEIGAGYDLPDTPAIIEYEVAGRQSTVHRWNGTLVSYDGVGIDPNTRTVPVRLVVSDPRRYLDEKGEEKIADRTSALMRGMFVRVRLLLKPSQNLVVIPGRALRPGNKVWKFTPDETIVDKLLAEKQIEWEKIDSAKNGSEQADAEQTKPSESGAVAFTGVEPPAATPFVADRWSAGLVQYSATVYPIDSLRLSGPQTLDPNLAPSLQTAGREWVCETKDGDLAGGDYVVVSPMESIPPEGLPARAEMPANSTE